MSKIRYHLDESVSKAVAIGLRARGIDVTTPVEADLLGASDRRQLAHSHSEQRVAVTHDDDFLRLNAAGVSHAGIAYCHQRNRTVGQIVGVLVHLWRNETAEDMRNVVTFL